MATTYPTPVLPTALSRGRADFFELAARYLEEYLAKIRVVVAELPPERFWWRPRAGANQSGEPQASGDVAARPTVGGGPQSNSAANLVLHLCGNLSLWLLKSVGGEPFERDRAAEFAATSGPGPGELLGRLEEVVGRCARLLRSLGPDDAARPLRIQAYETDVLGAVFHAVEHMSYHTGQLLFLLKQSLPEGAAVELYPQHRAE